jgi:hypothetical protein
VARSDAGRLRVLLVPLALQHADEQAKAVAGGDPLLEKILPDGDERAAPRQRVGNVFEVSGEISHAALVQHEQTVAEASAVGQHKERTRKTSRR